MPRARLWLALSAALRSLQGLPAFALTNWPWLRRAGWHEAPSSPPLYCPRLPPIHLAPPLSDWALFALKGGTRHQWKKKTLKHPTISCFDFVFEYQLANIQIWLSGPWADIITNRNYNIAKFKFRKVTIWATAFSVIMFWIYSMSR